MTKIFIPLILFILFTQGFTKSKLNDNKNDKIYEFFMVDVKPTIVSKVAPELTQEMISYLKSSEEKVTILVKATIDTSGEVLVTKIIKSNPIFNQSAIEAVKKYTFNPAKHLGKKVIVNFPVPISFGENKTKSVNRRSNIFTNMQTILVYILLQHEAKFDFKRKVHHEYLLLNSSSNWGTICVDFSIKNNSVDVLSYFKDNEPTESELNLVLEYDGDLWSIVKENDQSRHIKIRDLKKYLMFVSYKIISFEKNEDYVQKIPNPLGESMEINCTRKTYEDLKLTFHIDIDKNNELIYVEMLENKIPLRYRIKEISE